MFQASEMIQRSDECVNDRFPDMSREYFLVSEQSRPAFLSRASTPKTNKQKSGRGGQAARKDPSPPSLLLPPRWPLLQTDARVESANRCNNKAGTPVSKAPAA